MEASTPQDSPPVALGGEQDEMNDTLVSSPRESQGLSVIKVTYILREEIYTIFGHHGWVTRTATVRGRERNRDRWEAAHDRLRCKWRSGNRSSSGRSVHAPGDDDSCARRWSLSRSLPYRGFELPQVTQGACSLVF